MADKLGATAAPSTSESSTAASSTDASSTAADAPVASSAARKYLRLHLCPEVGAIRFANLLRELGGIDPVLSAGVARLQSVERVGPKVAESIAQYRDRIDIDAELALARRHGCRVICLADAEYPAALKMISDAPACLYVRGSLVRDDALAIAIVGSRRCSRYGAEQAERFAALAARAGLTVISGMARGIDSYAHRGALEAGGRTIAVMGCGLAHLYPPESSELAERIVQHGAIVSELAMNTAPDASNFPPRNRIIAGLSLGVVVVEAARRSGALITARVAGEYNREVFAVPGPIDSTYAEGVNDLIQQGAAKLVTRIDDVLGELGEAGQLLMQAAADSSERPPGGDATEYTSPHVATTTSRRPATNRAGRNAADAPTAASPPPAGLSDLQRRILAALSGGARPLDDVCAEVDAPPGRVASQLVSLQVLGAVHRLPGDLYEAARHARQAPAAGQAPADRLAP